jgi:hypothetical protein
MSCMSFFCSSPHFKRLERPLLATSGVPVSVALLRQRTFSSPYENLAALEYLHSHLLPYGQRPGIAIAAAVRRRAGALCLLIRCPSVLPRLFGPRFGLLLQVVAA